MSGDVVVYGAGGMGQEVADLVHLASEDGAGLRLIGFLDEDDRLHGTEVLGVPVLGDHRWLTGRSVQVAMAIGAPATRRRAWARLAELGPVQPATLVHPSAVIGRGSSVGAGTIVGAHATLTADVQVANLAIVNVAATISHNCRVADYATLAPGAHVAGNVAVGEGADIGIGAAVVQNVSIGRWSIVGAGTVVIAEVEADTTVVGSPARVVARRCAGWQL